MRDFGRRTRKRQDGGGFHRIARRRLFIGGFARWGMHEGAPQWVYLLGYVALFWGVQTVKYLFAAFPKSDKYFRKQ